MTILLTRNRSNQFRCISSRYRSHGQLGLSALEMEEFLHPYTLRSRYTLSYFEFVRLLDAANPNRPPGEHHRTSPTHGSGGSPPQTARSRPASSGYSRNASRPASGYTARSTFSPSTFPSTTAATPRPPPMAHASGSIVDRNLKDFAILAIRAMECRCGSPDAVPQPRPPSGRRDGQSAKREGRLRTSWEASSKSKAQPRGHPKRSREVQIGMEVDRRTQDPSDHVNPKLMGPTYNDVAVGDGELSPAVHRVSARDRAKDRAPSSPLRGRSGRQFSASSRPRNFLLDHRRSTQAPPRSNAHSGIEERRMYDSLVEDLNENNTDQWVEVNPNNPSQQELFTRHQRSAHRLHILSNASIVVQSVARQLLSANFIAVTSAVRRLQRIGRAYFYGRRDMLLVYARVTPHPTPTGYHGRPSSSLSTFSVSDPADHGQTVRKRAPTIARTHPIYRIAPMPHKPSVDDSAVSFTPAPPKVNQGTPSRSRKILSSSAKSDKPRIKLGHPGNQVRNNPQARRKQAENAQRRAVQVIEQFYEVWRATRMLKVMKADVLEEIKQQEQLASLVVLQQALRFVTSCRRYQQRIRVMRRKAAALTIQHAFKEYRARLVLARRKKAAVEQMEYRISMEANEAAVMSIVKNWRAHVARGVLKRAKIHRDVILNRSVRTERIAAAATDLQAEAFAHLSRRETAKRLAQRAAALIQAAYRSARTKLRRRRAATIVQCGWRRYHATVVLRRKREERDAMTDIGVANGRLNAAATDIQVELKALQSAQVVYQQWKHGFARRIQRAWRRFTTKNGNSQRRMALRAYLEELPKSDSAALIQECLRSLQSAKVVKRQVILIANVPLLQRVGRRWIAVKPLSPATRDEVHASVARELVEIAVEDAIHLHFLQEERERIRRLDRADEGATAVNNGPSGVSREKTVQAADAIVTIQRFVAAALSMREEHIRHVLPEERELLAHGLVEDLVEDAISVHSSTTATTTHTSDG